MEIYTPPATGAEVTLVLASTSITGGVTQQLLYDNAGKLGEVTKGNSMVLISDGSGVPSWSNSAIPALTYTGVQTVNLNAASLPAAITGATLRLGQADGTANVLEMRSWAAVTNFAAVRADGTAASPTKLVTSDNILNIQGRGYDNSGVYSTSQAGITFQAIEDWNDATHRGTSMIFQTTPLASGTLTTVLTLANAGSTFASPLTASAALTASTTLAVTGVTTPTGGIAAAGGFSVSPRIPSGWAALATNSGTGLTPNTTTTYVSEITIPANMTLTGVYYLSTAANTGNVTVGLATPGGVPIAAAKSASTPVLASAAFQFVPFSSQYAPTGPATYFIQMQFDTASASGVRGYGVGTHATTVQTSGSYGTFISFTPPTAFNASTVPIMGVY